MPFQTTDDLNSLTEIVGQPRAVEALKFGIDIVHKGYHIFAFGPPGTGKRSLVRQLLEQRSARETTPEDWCYVNNFNEPHKPAALHLPPGCGRELREDMEHLVEGVRHALTGAFSSDEFQNRYREVEEQVEKKRKTMLGDLEEKAKEKGLAIVQSVGGPSFAPLKRGEPMSTEEVKKLSEERKREYQNNAKELEKEARELFQELPRWSLQTQQQLTDLRREIAAQAIRPLLEDLKNKYRELPEVTRYLDGVMEDLIHRREELLSLHLAQQGEQKLKQSESIQDHFSRSMTESNLLRRYEVNVLVEHHISSGAPVIYEDHPTYQNLIGRIEHQAQMGALTSDFHLIKAGALHRANGGYLILDAYRLLMMPEAWEGLKRALRAEHIRIESLGKTLGLIGTVQLEPEPIPLKVKVVLLGSQFLYHILRFYDPDFEELFKVPADFSEHMERSDGAQELYAHLIATLARKEQLKPLGRAAVERVIEHSSRLAGDATKLSLDMRRVLDLLQEASYWSKRSGNGVVTAKDVERAIDTRIYRSDRLREEIQEEITRGMLLIVTKDSAVGQVNGLALMPSGQLWFGRPSRITARVRMGDGKLIDIEREVALGGPLHSKGVLILAGFLNGRYATDVPLSLSASLVFEQSYASVGGDSASSAELYALLSAIAQVPLKQSIAVTGSVNQHGQVQAIGAVNDKIEGFFDTCQVTDLTGNQGVLIPAANVQHLMLRQDVAEAVEKGMFHIWPVRTIDEGIEILTDLSAGAADDAGHYPHDTFNGRVQKRLIDLAEQRQQYEMRLQQSEDGF